MSANPQDGSPRPPVVLTYPPAEKKAEGRAEPSREPERVEEEPPWLTCQRRTEIPDDDRQEPTRSGAPAVFERTVLQRFPSPASPEATAPLAPRPGNPGGASSPASARGRRRYVHHNSLKRKNLNKKDET